MQKNADEAMKSKGVADRIFFLKAALPEVYNPVQKVEHQSAPRFSVSISEASAFLVRQGALEAEVLGKPSEPGREQNLTGEERRERPVEERTEGIKERKANAAADQISRVGGVACDEAAPLTRSVSQPVPCEPVESTPRSFPKGERQGERPPQ